MALDLIGELISLNLRRVGEFLFNKPISHIVIRSPQSSSSEEP